MIRIFRIVNCLSFSFLELLIPTMRCITLETVTNHPSFRKIRSKYVLQPSHGEKYVAFSQTKTGNPLIFLFSHFSLAKEFCCAIFLLHIFHLIFFSSSLRNTQ